MNGGIIMAEGRELFRKQITTPELIEQINPQNKQLVDRYLKNFATKRSPKSVKSYMSNYNIFFCWNLLYNDNKIFIDLKKYELMDFFDYGATELKWSPNRYAQVWSSLSSLSEWIENVFDEKYPQFKNIVKRIEKMPKENTRKKSVFSKPELDILMNWLGETNHIQEQCLLGLIMASGTRISETVRFTTTSIDYDNTAFDDLFLETTEEIQVKGRGVHGKRILRYLITDLFKPYYDKWLPIRAEIMKKNNQEHDYIFVRKNGTPAEVTTLRSWMLKWDDHLEKHWYPHAGRHFWTSYLLGIGLEAQLVQELQKWSSDSMLKIYNDNTAKDMKWKGLGKLKAHLEQNSNIKIADVEETEDEQEIDDNEEEID